MSQNWYPFLLGAIVKARSNQGWPFVAHRLRRLCGVSRWSCLSIVSAQPPTLWIASVPGIKSYTSSLSGLDSVYLANYVLYWIAFGITVGALVVTMLAHFGRPADFLASIATFFGFLVMLVTFIILLVLCLRGINTPAEGAYGRLGDCIWMHLGAMIALLFGSLWYCFTCIFGGPRK